MIIVLCLGGLVRFLALLFLVLYASSVPAEAEKPQICAPDEHWVSAYVQPTHYRADGTLVRSHPVSAHCRKNPAGYKKWHSKLHTGRPRVWGYRKEKSKAWTAAEIERVVEALGELPSLLLDQNIKRIYRMVSSLGRRTPATTNVALGDIVVYDSAFDTRHNLAYVLVHELAHQLYEGLLPSLKETYRNEMKWKKEPSGGGKIWVSRRPETQFVTPHTKGSPDEDFASNIEYFLFHPTKFKLVAPKAYGWIKKHFGDKLRGKSR